MGDEDKAADKAAEAARAEEAKKVQQAATAVAAGEDVTHITLPNGSVFKATKEDLLFLATRGAAEEFLAAERKAKGAPAAEPTATAAAGAPAAATGTDAEIKELKQQLKQLTDDFANEKSANRINARKAEIVSAIDAALTVNPIVKDKPELRKQVQATILTTLLQNPSQTTQAAIDSTLSMFENFSKEYMGNKRATKDATRGAPPGGTGGAGNEAPKPFTLKDMKEGKIRNRVTERMKEAQAAGAFQV